MFVAFHEQENEYFWQIDAPVVIDDAKEHYENPTHWLVEFKKQSPSVPIVLLQTVLAEQSPVGLV